MNATAIVTIVSNNYLHFARTLMQSVARQHPGADRYCVVVDRDLSHATALAAEFTPLELASLNLPDGDDFLFQYDVLELNTAVKPWALEHLLRRGYRNVLYIDPDIWLYRPLDHVFALLDAGANMVLTPHLLAPVTDVAKPGELDVRRAGTYNLGFCALRAGDNAIAIVRWWQGKLRRHCIVAFEQGIFVDQSWMDLVPGLFPDVAILRHPGYNVAYWNLAQRPVTGAADDYAVLGEPLAFFHFSGLNPLAPHTVSKYQDRFTLDDVGTSAASLIRDYCARVIDNGLRHYRALPYAYGAYDDGAPVDTADRLRFRTAASLRERARGLPFAARTLLAEPAAQKSSPGARTGPGAFKGAVRRSVGLIPPAYRRMLRDTALELMGRLPKSSRARARQAARRLRNWLWHTGAMAPVDIPAVPAQPAIIWQQTRPSPYGGLHAPEPDSAVQGLWVGPRLDLPVCELTNGSIRIEGAVDLGLLTRQTLQLEIHGPHGLLRTENLTQNGSFTLEFAIPAEAFAGGCQWTVLASAHGVPKLLGLGEDIRALAWRVRRIAVDGVVLIDSARSPAALAIDRLLPPGGINLVGYLAAELGVGEAARSLARACLAADIPFSAVDVGYQSSNRQTDTALLAHAVDQRFPIDVLYVNADQTAVTSAHLKGHGLEARYRIGVWHWEQPELPPEAMSAFAHIDEVWVPSTFVHDAVAPWSPVPVVRIPHALDFAPGPGATRRQFGLPEDRTLVLTMYDFHSYQYRKNPQAALAAFRLAAAGRRDVALVIKTINGRHHAAALQALRESVADLDNILFIDEFLTRQQTWDLEACCDILLSLHRAEGFGLAPAEMMHLGKPVVATGWSANMDFMTADNAFPVRYELRPLAEAVGVYPAGQLWAEADIDHAADCLDRLFDDPGLRRSVGAAAARDIRAQLSPRAVGAQVYRRLAVLAWWHPALRPEK